MTPFDIMGDLGKRIYTQEEVEANLNIYLLIQYLKCSPITISFAEYLNSNYKLDIYQMYLLAYYALPKGVRIRWIKTDKNAKDEDIILMQEHYVCGREVAMQYLELLPKEEFKRIEKMYQHGTMKGKK